jgi:DNA-binding GntR family transcriptional regulator
VTWSVSGFEQARLEEEARQIREAEARLVAEIAAEELQRQLDEMRKRHEEEEENEEPEAGPSKKRKYEEWVSD